MAEQVKKLYELGIVDASFIGLDAAPVTANAKQNNAKSFGRDKFKPENRPKADLDCALGVHPASSQHNERRYEFHWGYKNHILVDGISGPPLYELTTPANKPDVSVVSDILCTASTVLSLQECTSLGDKGYDAKAVYNLEKDVYHGEAVIPLNKHNTKNPDKLPSGRLICDAECVMHKPLMPSTIASARNSAARSEDPKPKAVPATTKAGTTAKNQICTKYVTLPTDYRLSIDRDCLHFERTYVLLSPGNYFN